MAEEKKTVVIGMSGGVDSSVAAYLLKEQGYHVIGVTMQIWQPEDTCSLEREGGCCGLQAVEDARRVAQQLDIPYYVMNFRDEFEKKVIQYFVKEYLHGRTPNPCIACNHYVKWESLLQRSMEIGADYIATGHYARVVQISNGRYAIHTSVTQQKDQSYALYGLTQHQLEHTLMPVGEYTKPEIRQIAEKIGLQVAHKPDSQEICFVSDGDYAGFIRQQTGIAEKPGDFVTKSGEVLGQHKGISHYTVGQRKGLNLALGYPVFVTEIRPESREVVLGKAEDVFSQVVRAKDWSGMAIESLHAGQEVMAKIRYSHKGQQCKVISVDEMAQQGGSGGFTLEFQKPVRAATPGQAVVLYENGYILGGGVIC